MNGEFWKDDTAAAVLPDSGSNGVRRLRPPRPAETIKVGLGPEVTPDVARTLIGRLVEEWAALTYASMANSAMAAANQPMSPSDEPASNAPACAVGAV